MAQPARIEIEVDVTEARRRVKRVIAEAQEANRELAKLEEHLAAIEAHYAEVVRNAYRIKIETPERKEHTSNE